VSEKRKNKSYFFIKVSTELQEEQFLRLLRGIKQFDNAQIYLMGNDRRLTKPIIEGLNKFLEEKGVDSRFYWNEEKPILSERENQMENDPQSLTGHEKSIQADIDEQFSKSMNIDTDLAKKKADIKLNRPSDEKVFNDDAFVFPLLLDKGERNDIRRRDLFAAMNAQGLLGNETFLKNNPDPEAIADFCYAVADACIKKGRSSSLLVD